jgi:hypothetical protein
MSESTIERKTTVTFWQAMLFAAMAGGLGWGIRGQYGHETGATMAGLLTCLTLACLLAPHAHPLALARAVAMGAIAMGIGGSMTYGQTVGLTHDAELVGNVSAWRWGMLGLAIKGALWIGFGGLFLGMGLGGVRYRPGEILMLMLSMVGLFTIGCGLLNAPFNPAERELPAIYFSASWEFFPEKADLKPRLEIWGGMLLALAGGVFYAGWRKRDVLARNLALWAMLGGAIGFPLGQSIQSYNAWNREAVVPGTLEYLAPIINWWNMMETTFGAVMGAALALGLWLNRRRIAPAEPVLDGRLSGGAEWLLLALHVPLLISVEFLFIRWIDSAYDLGLILAAIPLAAIVGGRYWPYFTIYPIILLPIAGKTLRNLGYEEGAVSLSFGWAVFVILPLALFTWLALRAIGRYRFGGDSRAMLGGMLLATSWMYFLLNFAFFRFPFPWDTWTGRTPNALIYCACMAGLTFVALRAMRGKKEGEVSR